MLFNKKNYYSKKYLLLSSIGELFGKTGPILPIPNMLMLDRIVNIQSINNNKGIIKAELDINPYMWFFDCHFINDPIMPGCLGIEGMWQILAFYLGWIGGKGKGRALGIEQVIFLNPILPSSKLITYIIYVHRIIKRNNNQYLLIGIADGEIWCDGIIVYTAKNIKLGLFN